MSSQCGWFDRNDAVRDLNLNFILYELACHQWLRICNQVGDSVDTDTLFCKQFGRQVFIHDIGSYSLHFWLHIQTIAPSWYGEIFPFTQANNLHACQPSAVIFMVFSKETFLRRSEVNLAWPWLGIVFDVCVMTIKLKHEAATNL